MFDALVGDLRECLGNCLHNRDAKPSAMILDGRTLQLAPKRGSIPGFDDAKKRKRSKAHIAVDSPG